MQLSRGQRLKLLDLVPDGQRFTLGATLDVPGATVDIACFGLDGRGRLADERYMTFFNQPETPCGGVRLVTPAGDAAGFAVDLGRLPPGIERLTLTAAIDGAATMRGVTRGWVRLLDAEREAARFAFSGADFADERALILFEVYRKDGVWRLCALGQGFNGGLAALVESFGGAVAGAAPTSTPAPTSPGPAPRPEPVAEPVSESSPSPAGGGQNRFQQFVEGLKQKASELKSEALRLKNKDLMQAAVSGSVLVAMADGSISGEEKRKMMLFIENYEPLSVFPAPQLIAAFQELVGQIDFDRDLGEAKAYEMLRKIRRRDAEARLVMRLIIAVAGADGVFDQSERRVARQIALELGIDPAEFELG